MRAVIEHTASLVLQLKDATNGALIDTGVKFFVDGVESKPMSKPNGFFVFLDELPDTFTLELRASGFETERLSMKKDTDLQLSARCIELIPDCNNARPVPCLTLKGRLEGLESLDAVRVGENPCLYKSFDPKKKILTIFNPHRLEMERLRYAVVDLDAGTYEPFIITKRISDTAFTIEDTLSGSFSEHSHISPLMRGTVDTEGNYLLRVRDMYSDSRHLVRSQVQGRESFSVISFSEPMALRIEDPPP